MDGMHAALDLAPPRGISSGGPQAEHRATDGPATQFRHPIWIVVATEYQADGDAALYLDGHGFDVRSFTVQVQRPALGKRPAYWAFEPAFPGYLIVRLSPTDPIQPLRADSRNGIAGWLHAVGAADTPAALPDTAMLALLDMASANFWTGELCCLGRIGERGTLQPIPKPGSMFPDLAGASLEVADHPYLAGFRGECLSSGPERVVLLLRMLGAERRVTVRRDAVRVVG